VFVVLLPTETNKLCIIALPAVSVSVVIYFVDKSVAVICALVVLQWSISLVYRSY